MDPSIIAALMMMQQAGAGGPGGASAMPGGPGGIPGVPGGQPMQADPALMSQSLGALLTGGGGMNPPGGAPSTSSDASPTGDTPVPPAPGAQPGFLGPATNPVPGIAVQQPPLGTPTSLPGTVMAPSIGSAPVGFNTGTQSPGGTGGVPPGAPGVPSTAAQAGGNPLAGLAGFKAPPAPQPIMPHAGPGQTPHLPVVQGKSQMIASLLQALMGARGTQPLGIPALGAALRGGV